MRMNSYFTNSVPQQVRRAVPIVLVACLSLLAYLSK